MNVLCILTNGFEEIEAIGTIAILRRANINVDIYSLHSNFATGRFDVTISNLSDLNSLKLDNYDLLFIPGGSQYKELQENQFFKNVVLDFYYKNKRIAAICAGPTILGRMGLLRNKNYTCFNSMNTDFGGCFIDRYVVKDNNLITGKSAAATIDFAFAIVEELLGKNQAENVKNSIYYYNK